MRRLIDGFQNLIAAVVAAGVGFVPAWFAHFAIGAKTAASVGLVLWLMPSAAFADRWLSFDAVVWETIKNRIVATEIDKRCKGITADQAALAAEWEDLTGFLESKGYPKARLDAQMKPPAINQIYALIDDELWHYDGRLTDKNPKALCTLAEANMKNRMGIHQLIRKELN